MAGIISSVLLVVYIILLKAYLELNVNIKDEKIFEHRGYNYKCESLGAVDDESNM